MSDDTLSAELQFAETHANVAGTPTPVVTWDVPDGTAITILQGHPAIVDLENVNGNNLPRSSKIGLAYREPGDPLDDWTVISETAIAPYNTLSLKDQQSGDNAERRRVRFDPDRVPGGRLNLADADELALVVLSDAEVDPASIVFNYPMQMENV